MKNYKISIIIPIYNSEKWLRDCLISITNQKYQNLEVLLINDGSTDNSSSICKEYCVKYKYFFYYENSNHGVSYSRNFGITHSTGDFVMFIDSDDYILDDIIDLCCKRITENSDTVLFENAILKDGLFKKNTFICDKVEKNLLLSCCISNLNNDEFFFPNFRSCWGKIYSRKILIDYKVVFNESLYIGEDAVFNIQYFINAKDVYYCNELGYIYRYVDTSAVRRKKDDLFDQIKNQFDFFNNNILWNIYSTTAIVNFAYESCIDLIKNYSSKNIFYKWFNYFYPNLCNKKIVMRWIPMKFIRYIIRSSKILPKIFIFILLKLYIRFKGLK